MKRLFVAVCCTALFGLNVSAQEASVVVQDDTAKSVVVQAPDSEATFASQDETPQPDIPEIQESTADEAPVVIQEEGAVPPAPAVDAVPAAPMVAAGSACGGCAQPVVMSAPSGCCAPAPQNCCQQTTCCSPAPQPSCCAPAPQSCCPQPTCCAPPQPTCCAPQPTCCPQQSCCNTATRVTLRDRLAARRAARTARRSSNCCY